MNTAIEHDCIVFITCVGTWWSRYLLIQKIECIAKCRYERSMNLFFHIHDKNKTWAQKEYNMNNQKWMPWISTRIFSLSPPCEIRYMKPADIYESRCLVFSTRQVSGSRSLLNFFPYFLRQVINEFAVGVIQWGSWPLLEEKSRVKCCLCSFPEKKETNHECCDSSF